MVNGGQISNDYPYTQGTTATSFKVCEVTGDTAPFTETNCVNFAPSDPIGTVKLLPTTGPTDTQWLVMTDLGDGHGLSTGVMVFSAMPTQSDLNNQTTGSLITSQITGTDQAQTAAFQKSTGDTIYTGLFTSG